MSQDLCQKVSKLNREAKLHQQKKNFSTSIALLKEAEQLIIPPYVPRYLKCITYFNLANYYQILNQRLKSLKYLSKILKITQDKPILAKAHLNMGFIFSQQSLHQKSLFHNLKALSLLENTEEWEGLVSAYHSIGLEYKEMGQFKKSIGYVKAGLICSKEKLGVNHKLTKILRNCYIETSRIMALSKYRDFDVYKMDNFEIRKIVNDLESAPKRISPLPKYLKSKNSTPTPNKLTSLSQSVQYDYESSQMNKSTQSKFSNFKYKNSSLIKYESRRSLSSSYQLEPIPNKSKIELTKKAMFSLVTEKDYDQVVRIIQKYAKMWISKKKFKKIKKNIGIIENFWKMCKIKTEYKRIKKCIVNIQRIFRGFRIRKLYKFLLHNDF